MVLAILVASLGPAAGQGVIEERDRVLLGEPAGRPLAGEELRQATEAVTSLMRCPVCQGLSVADSHTPSAIAMKAKAEALLAAGYSSAQVLIYFESSYGEFIRLEPRPEGFNLVVWILPGVALLIGLGLVWMRIRRRPAAPREAEKPEEDLEAYRRRVREEIGR
ncbi:MAG: cytochrome c-type biogenesis protein CcmH [Thermoanaerobaculia bacterium]|nr:cytochrome c-type biogenesis protein CcmH [Thermoanaerobaculia bacterium]